MHNLNQIEEEEESELEYQSRQENRKRNKKHLQSLTKLQGEEL